MSGTSATPELPGGSASQALPQSESSTSRKLQQEPGRAEGHQADLRSFSNAASGLSSATWGTMISLASANTNRLRANAVSRVVRRTSGGQAVMTSIRPSASDSRSSAVGRYSVMPRASTLMTRPLRRSTHSGRGSCAQQRPYRAGEAPKPQEPVTQKPRASYRLQGVPT